MIEKKASLVPGILLIAVGLWLFVNRINVLSYYSFRIYPILMILFAVFLFEEAVRRRHSGALFWGVVVFLVGGFFLLRNFEIIPHFYAEEYWPIFLIAMGFGFITKFVFNPKDWGVLIPGGLFLFFGIGFSMRTLSGYFWRWEYIVEDYWPVILIVIGAAVLLSGLRKKPKE